MPIEQTRFAQLEYLDDGPRTGTPVVMVHGFPDIPATWDGVMPLLPRGVRVIRPFLRGVGCSRVIDPEAQSGQVAALATDLCDLLDALQLESVVMVGHDWGARAAHALAALEPRRVTALVTMATAYGSSSSLSGQDALDEVAVAWYRYWLCTSAGASAFRDSPHDLIRWAWKRWSPSFTLSSDELDDILSAVDTESFADSVVHYYRHGTGEAPGCAPYRQAQEILDTWPTISVPTTFLIGNEDGCETMSLARSNGNYFTSGRELIELEAVGHFIPREDPRAVANAIAKYL
jgi:pimeloyl-ACP methyl ester carboxylesterase